MKAELIRDNLEGFTGHAALYRLSPPLKDEDFDGKITEYEFVVASATNAMFSGAETYLFPADSEGKVLSWGELDGSYRGGLSHEMALNGAGYKL